MTMTDASKKKPEISPPEGVQIIDYTSEKKSSLSSYIGTVSQAASSSPKAIGPGVRLKATTPLAIPIDKLNASNDD
jgi:hypothetical protein